MEVVPGARAWAELRQQLGIGWNTSPDYVLVNKQAIRDVWFNKLHRDGMLSDDSVKLLSLSPEEQKAVRAALAAACEGQWLNVRSTPPGGDIVAQYTITPPDPAFVAGQSNAFAADITAAMGAERASYFLHDAWRELMSGAAPSEAKTMTIRQTNVDGQPDLVCEVTQGANISTMPVRYACYPYFPVLKLFPGGGGKPRPKRWVSICRPASSRQTYESKAGIAGCAAGNGIKARTLNDTRHRG